jgi:ribosomal protein L7/L12
VKYLDSIVVIEMSIRRLVVPVSRRLVSPKVAVRGNQQFIVNMQWRAMSSAGSVDENSWAQELIMKQGGKVTPAAAKDDIEFNDASLNNPSEKVKKLIDELCKLTVGEAGQLYTLLAVRTHSKVWTKFLLCDGFCECVQERLGVPIGGGGGGGEAVADAAAAPAAAAPAKKEVFDVKLKVVDAKAKLKVIKEIRTITGLGLKEVFCHPLGMNWCMQLTAIMVQAKELVEKTPVTVKTGVKPEEAEAIKKVLVEAGAEVEVD